MTAETMELHPTPFDPVRIEITSPGASKNGRRFYEVDFVEADGFRSGMWSGTDVSKALEAAAHCANGEMPIVDLVGAGLCRH